MTRATLTPPTGPTAADNPTQTMKAIGQGNYGTAAQEVWRLEEIARPTIGDDDILIQVRAAALDMGTWHIMTGLPYLLRLIVPAFGLRGPKHAVPGGDVAGVVAAVGANVTRFKVGDEVFGTCDGSVAEYATTTPDRLAPKPSNLDFEQAAAVPTSAVAALQALRKGDVAAGDRVLILGAGGGVGSYAVQLAKTLGAHVTGVCSTGKIDLVRSLGADDVIDYTQEDIDAQGKHWDVVLDGVGNRSLRRLRRVLAPRGTLVFFGGEGGRWTGGTGRWLRAMLLSPFLRQNLRVLSTVIRSEDLQALTELIEAGDVVPAVDRSFPIADAAKAIDELRAGHVRGKVVLTP